MHESVGLANLLSLPPLSWLRTLVGLATSRAGPARPDGSPYGRIRPPTRTGRYLTQDEYAQQSRYAQLGYASQGSYGSQDGYGYMPQGGYGGPLDGYQ